MPKISNRVLEMNESVTLAASAKAKQLKEAGKDIISLTLGEPDFSTPKNIQEKAITAIQNGSASYYTVASGMTELKLAIQTYMHQYYGYSVDLSEIVAGTGAKYILFAFFMSVLNPDDEVIIPTPYWVSYADQVKMAQGKVVFVDALESNHFKITTDQLDKVLTTKTKVLLLNSPSNPTGVIYTKEELEAIGNWAVEHDIIILADDIYGRLVYNGNQFVPSSTISEKIRKQTMVINGVSKTYAMTGWRLGFAVGNSTIISAMSKIISQTTSSLTTVSQFAAIEALIGDQSEVEKMRLAFEKRLNLIYPLLSEVPGFKVVKPQGAFYLFPNVKEAMEKKGYSNVTAFTNAILDQVGLALVTGEGFGSNENLRLSYATDEETLLEAIRRLNQFMK
ncbi:hypothetical protein HMPREF9318_00023 [Streptococcus urinalis FB127-CNA-2]|uniref:Aminotransferase n=1 Tax=Streptococcus urinalis 2285-97 TaxID=764291 RepID=G5KE48_9STRE|nr:pyridoxal phosphate-dependent aminotransferase [Streptococcus urinalis]EHJ57712.1 aspartate transaminase [Streptococcus urinalis 2285-97]EKS21825.1 hypothetical protein HMPREF9318_00023 [Streptococcus urinalis FB127-CNA-2]VEF31638.1 aspartate aminotransferase [Streptococcus urinalis]